jgi:hypothetical protein
MENTMCSILGSRESTVLLTGSQASSASPFDKSSMEVKTLESLEVVA